MGNDFQEFLQAEVEAMLSSMDEDCRCDPQSRCRAAMVWISRNAERFRAEWERSHRIWNPGGKCRQRPN
jgi:hypothetical protein